jgi:hypothetical protein
MPDLKIERVNLNIENAAGQGHRIRPIAVRAVTLLAEHLDERLAAGGRGPDTRKIGGLSAPPINLSLRGMSDDRAAQVVADALSKSLARYL